jgi:VanZ family protein
MHKRSHVAILLACFVLTGVSFVSFLPVAGKRALHTEGRLHAGLHFVVFSVVGFVVFRAARSRAARIAAFAGAVLFGLAIEVGEHLVYRGDMEWKDVLVDTIGVVVGTLLAMVSAPRQSV